MQRVGRKTLVESPSESIVESLSEYNFIMYKIDRLFLSNDKKLFDQMHLIIFFFLFTPGIGKDIEIYLGLISRNKTIVMFTEEINIYLILLQ